MTPRDRSPESVEPDDARLEAIVRRGVELQPSADLVLCSAASVDPKGSSFARQSFAVADEYRHLRKEVLGLDVPEDVRTRVAALLDYHQELVGQASIMAFRSATPSTARVRQALRNGLGTPAKDLRDVLDSLATNTRMSGDP
jgi:hypothetical protein